MLIEDMEAALEEAGNPPSGQITLVVCDVCSQSSLIATGQARVCGTCKGIGSHEDGCINDRPWAV